MELRLDAGAGYGDGHAVKKSEDGKHAQKAENLVALPQTAFLSTTGRDST